MPTLKRKNLNRDLSFTPSISSGQIDIEDNPYKLKHQSSHKTLDPAQSNEDKELLLSVLNSLNKAAENRQHSSFDRSQKINRYRVQSQS